MSLGSTVDMLSVVWSGGTESKSELLTLSTAVVKPVGLRPTVLSAKDDAKLRVVGDWEGVDVSKA